MFDIIIMWKSLTPSPAFKIPQKWVEMVWFSLFLLTDFVVADCGAIFKLYSIQKVLLCQNPDGDDDDDHIIISPYSFDIRSLQQHEQSIFMCWTSKEDDLSEETTDHYDTWP